MSGAIWRCFAAAKTRPLDWGKTGPDTVRGEVTMAEGPYLMGIDGGTESVSTRVGV
jgi:hypothetical protein